MGRAAEASVAEGSSSSSVNGPRDTGSSGVGPRESPGSMAPGRGRSDWSLSAVVDEWVEEGWREEGEVLELLSRDERGGGRGTAPAGGEWFYGDREGRGGGRGRGRGVCTFRPWN